MKDTFKHQGLRQKLVSILVKKGIQDELVLAAIGKIPRHLFMDSGFLDHAYQDKDFELAIVYYRKAAKMANYLHEPYAGIARAKHRLGKNKAAQNSMLKALANSHKEETTKRYQSKYEFFQAMIDTD